jgi:hypothetical protein
LALIVRIKPRALRQIEQAAQWWSDNRPAPPGAIRKDLDPHLPCLRKSRALAPGCIFHAQTSSAGCTLAACATLFTTACGAGSWKSLRCGMKAARNCRRFELCAHMADTTDWQFCIALKTFKQ